MKNKNIKIALTKLLRKGWDIINIIFFLASIFIPYLALFSPSEFGKYPATKLETDIYVGSIVYFPIAFLLFTYLLSRFAINLVCDKIHVINNPSSDGREQSPNLEENSSSPKPFLEKACQFCGHEKTGHYLCSGCNSILWYNFGKGEGVLRIMVFLLQHRWAVLTTISATLLLFPVTFLWHQHEKIQSDKISAEKDLNEIFNNLTEVRSSLINLESDTSYNIDAFNQMSKIYTNYFWNVIPTIQRLITITKETNPKFGEVFEDPGTLKLNEKSSKGDSSLFYTAKLISNPKFDITGVEKYLDYINCVAKYNYSHDQNKLKSRKSKANTLFHHLRASSIILRTFIDNEYILKTGKYTVSDYIAKIRLEDAFLNIASIDNKNTPNINDTIRIFSAFNLDTLENHYHKLKRNSGNTLKKNNDN